MTVVAEQFAESRVAITGQSGAAAHQPRPRGFKNGGATALGVISAVRYLTMAVLASILSVLVCAAIVLADGPAAPVYVLSEQAELVVGRFTDMS